MENWMNGNKGDNSMVISSGVKLLRNFDKIPFPDRLDSEKAKNIVKQVEDAFLYGDNYKENYNIVHLWENKDIDNNIHIYKNLITPKLISNSNKSAFIYNDEETKCIMINEEDHIVIQCITSGFNLKDAFNEADEIDDEIERKINYAFDEKLGYITACPTNLGTGMIASVMLHLPALVITNEISQVLNAVSHLGMNITSIYGRKSKSESNIFCVSNQITLGINENEILNNLTAIVNQIINQEKLARDKILKKYKYEVQNKIMRSLGVLKYSVMLKDDECLKLLSNVRLGVELGIINDVDMKSLNYLLVETQPSVLKNRSNENLSQKDMSIRRAKIIREKLNIEG